MTAPALPRPTGNEPCRRAPDRWFGKGITDKQAAQMCTGCPLLNACAAYGLAYSASGIWGGLTEDARDAYRKDRKIVPISLLSDGTPSIVHGSEAGAKAHRRRHERPCEPCRKADVLAHAERKQVRAG